MESPPEFGHGEENEAKSSDIESASEKESPRRSRQETKSINNSNDFGAGISKFEGKLEPEEFLDWISTVEQIFEHKEVSKGKKVKLVALKLRRYASLRWTNLCAKRVKNHKDKLRTWDKMKVKMKARFLPSSYVQDRSAQLHNLTERNMNVDKYTKVRKTPD